MIRLAIVTISDKSSRGEREDAGGPAIRETLGVSRIEFEEVDYRVVPDEIDDIQQALMALGYSDKDAAAALKALPKDVGVSDGIKLALKALAR